MKVSFKIIKILIFILAVSCLNAETIQRRRLRQINLDNSYEPFISVGELTTVMFPSTINGNIMGKNVKIYGNKLQQGDFSIEVPKGKNYFTLRCDKPGATGSLNVVFNRKLYMIGLQQGTPGDGSVVFINEQRRSSRGGSYSQRKSVPPLVQLSLIDKTKLYNRFELEHPEALARTMKYEPRNPDIYEYPDYNIYLMRAVRFNDYDTIVFHVELENKTDKEIYYNPKLFAVKCANETYYSVFQNASGSMPPKSTTTAYFTITGDGQGGSNNLRPDSTWTVFLQADGVVDKVKAISREAEIYAEMKKLYSEKDPDKVLKKVKLLEDELSKIKSKVNEIEVNDQIIKE